MGLFLFLSGGILAVALLALDTRVAEDLLRHHPVLFGLRAGELVAALCLTFSGMMIPRRPDVFHDGQMVDRMYTAQALSRFQFHWPQHVLDLASVKKNLDMADLPRPNQYTRAEEVSDDWKRRNYSSSLWVYVMRAHGEKFALQWLLTLMSAVLNFAPQWVILQLLRILERRVPGQTYGLDVWVWVVWLGIVIVSQAVCFCLPLRRTTCMHTDFFGCCIASLTRTTVAGELPLLAFMGRNHHPHPVPAILSHFREGHAEKRCQGHWKIVPTSRP